MFEFIQVVVFVIYFSVLARVTYIMLSTHCPPCFLSNVTVVIMAILFFILIRPYSVCPNIN